MRLDYWNDPLVVSAFRVRFRGAAPSIMAGTWFLVLVSLGGILHHYLAEDPRVSWIQVYFIVLISLETIVCGLFAMMATWQSMHAEVVNRTLDYQRIAAVPPRDILIGKLLGEPAQGYLMTLAGLPLLIWCSGMGAAPPGILLPLLIQVITTAALLGTAGLVHPLEVGGDKARVSSRVLRNVGLVIVGLYVLQMSVVMPFAINNPLAQIPLGMLTPVFAIIGVARETPLLYGLPFYFWELPWLYFTPFAQLAIAGLILHSITRRLISPVNVALSKPTAYGVLLVIDVLLAGALLDPRAVPPTVNVRMGSFCIAHLLAALALTFSITPSRECLKSWVWRFRGRRHWLVDLFVGERTENIAALVTFCIQGVIAAVVLVLLPATYENQALRVIDLVGEHGPMLATMCLLILTGGSLYQLLLSIGQAGMVVFVGVTMVLIAAPHITGSLLQMPLLIAMSPSGQFANWMARIPDILPLWPLLAVYGTLLVGTRLIMTRRLNSAITVVDRKIAEILAQPA